MAERKTRLETLECRQKCPHGGRCGTQLERIRRRGSGDDQIPEDAKICAASLIRVKEKLASLNDNHQVHLKVRGARRIVFSSNGSAPLLCLKDGEIFARKKELIAGSSRGN